MSKELENKIKKVGVSKEQVNSISDKTGLDSYIVIQVISEYIQSELEITIKKIKELGKEQK